MASLESRREVPHESNLRCPVCGSLIPIKAVVDLTSGSTRYVGSAGFNKPMVSVSINTKIVGFKLSHECQYEEPK